MSETAQGLLLALEHTTSAFASVRNVSGSTNPFADSNLREIEMDLRFACRRLRKLCELYGCSLRSIAKAELLNGMNDKAGARPADE